MRLVYKKYADGTYKLYQTDEKGRNEKVLESDVPDDKVVRRVPVYIELSCDADHEEDVRDGLNRLSKSLKK